jgi:hypothetical protein
LVESGGSLEQEDFVRATDQPSTVIPEEALREEAIRKFQTLL